MTTEPTPKKRKNSKAKGNTYELAIAKKLGAWWGEKFQRTPASGGLHWRKDNRVYGDIVVPPDSDFVFCVECKNRESWNMDALFKGSSEVSKWWAQVTKDAEETGLKPMLIFTRNLQPDYVMFHNSDACNMIDADIKSISVFVNGEWVQVFSLDEFLTNFSKQDILTAFDGTDYRDLF